MNPLVDIKLLPSELQNEDLILKKAVKKANIPKDAALGFKIRKRSIDARQRQAVYRLKVELLLSPDTDESTPIFKPTPLHPVKKVIIVGAGPAGYFAALKCLENGLKPIVLDRGKDVQARRRDLKAIQQDGIVNPHSNYCFGEGGAGTYSDGKLYTRSHKRGNIKDILQILVDHGASGDILIDAHPHIGSNKLPKIIAQIRESILDHGGEIHFDSYVTDFLISNKSIDGVSYLKDNKQIELFADATILATGHSARDIFGLCDKYELGLEFKPFALGVRMEHPQHLIDKVQYNQAKREVNLPASSYRLACQIDGTGVFSFCMCPGGLIVPAATNPGELVVNGMSLSKRDSPYANAGIVVEISQDYLARKGYTGVFAGVEFQQTVETAFFQAGDGTQKAPAQRLVDFVDQKLTRVDMKSSYIPGLISAPVHEILPQDIVYRLQEASKLFDQKLNGFLSEEAHVVGVESRTSSPIRLERDRSTFMSGHLNGFFPCGEGAGYAGGILSAAIDGRNVADAVNSYLDN